MKIYIPTYPSFSSILQVENEYGYYEKDYGESGKRYVQWAANMALSQNIGVPWIMCQQWDTPHPIVSSSSPLMSQFLLSFFGTFINVFCLYMWMMQINTCNSFYCDDFTPLSPTAPKIWTENWPGW